MSHQISFNVTEMVIGNVVDTEEKHSIPALYRTQILSISFLQDSELIVEVYTERNGAKSLNSRGSQTIKLLPIVRCIIILYNTKTKKNRTKQNPTKQM